MESCDAIWKVATGAKLSATEKPIFLDIENHGQPAVVFRGLDIGYRLRQNIVFRVSGYPVTKGCEHQKGGLGRTQIEAHVQRNDINARGFVSRQLRQKRLIMSTQWHTRVVVPDDRTP